jgi:RNA 2',3'-cyclic 3'-phosphodiesterase
VSVRLFAAVDLPDEARGRVAAALRPFRESLAAAGLDGAFRWVAPENLHLTLRFLGAVPDDAAARAIAAMREPLAFEAPRITLGGLGTFPPRGRPRVLHVAVEEGVEALGALRDAVDARLSPLCRWEPETRPFAPHLTLARARDAATVRVDDFARLRADAAWPALAFDAAEVTLFSSKTLPSGPVYTAEARAALRS